MQCKLAAKQTLSWVKWGPPVGPACWLADLPIAWMRGETLVGLPGWLPTRTAASKLLPSGTELAPDTELAGEAFSGAVAAPALV